MIIINELIKITEDNTGRRLVSARELHEFLEIKKHITQWIKPYISKENDYGFVENQDYIRIDAEVNPTNGIPSIDYALTTEMAKELSMLSKSHKGKQPPRDYLSALKALVRSEEEKALMQPQVDYYQKVLNPNAESAQTGFVKFVTITAIAKDLHMTAQKLNKLLNDLHIVFEPLMAKVTRFLFHRPLRQFIPRLKSRVFLLLQ